MKKTRLKGSILAMATLLVLCSCGGNKNAINRTKALDILNKIDAAYNSNINPIKDGENFIVSKDETIKVEKFENSSITSSFDEESKSISNSYTLITSLTGVSKTSKVSLYRYSSENKYASISEPTTDGSYSIRGFIKQFDTDTKEYFYYIKETKKVVAGVEEATKEYSKVEDTDGSEFKAFVNYIRGKANETINDYSKAETSKNYLNSLPAELDKNKSKEEYLSLGEGSVYFRVTGSEGNSALSSFGLTGTQNIYLKRYKDNVCSSSYIEAKDINYQSNTNEKFTLGGGVIKNVPIKANSVTFTVNDSSIGEGTVTVTDNGEGKLVANDKVIDGAYINYETGEFLIASEKCSVTAKYESNIDHISYNKYAFGKDKFVPTDATASSTTGYTEVAYVSYK